MGREEGDTHNKVGASCLHLSAAGGHRECVEWLLSRFPSLFVVCDPGPLTRTALMCAALSNRVSVVSLLCSLPSVDANARNAHGESALSLAWHATHTEVIAVLAGAGAVCEETDRESEKEGAEQGEGEKREKRELGEWQVCVSAWREGRERRERRIAEALRQDEALWEMPEPLFAIIASWA